MRGEEGEASELVETIINASMLISEHGEQEGSRLVMSRLRPREALILKQESQPKKKKRTQNIAQTPKRIESTPRMRKRATAESQNREKAPQHVFSIEHTRELKSFQEKGTWKENFIDSNLHQNVSIQHSLDTAEKLEFNDLKNDDMSIEMEEPVRKAADGNDSQHDLRFSPVSSNTPEKEQISSPPISKSNERELTPILSTIYADSGRPRGRSSFEHRLRSIDEVVLESDDGETRSFEMHTNDEARHERSIPKDFQRYDAGKHC
jgi:hypothetical protein